MEACYLSNQLIGEAPSLRHYALSITRNRDLAEDLVQDTMERALTKAHLFDGQNLRGWLRTICRRIFLNGLRRQNRQGFSVEFDETVASEWLGRPADQEKILEAQEVLSAFGRLPLQGKKVLSLVVMDGMSYQEAANALDIPLGTVRSRVSRARERLHRACTNRPLGDARSERKEQEGSQS